MARYIDVDKFLKDETKRCCSVPSIGSCTTDNESLAYVLAQTPTADVVEVVRCKDCIHFEAITLDSGISVGFGNCKTQKGINLYPKETDFCSYGERSDT